MFYNRPFFCTKVAMTKSSWGWSDRLSLRHAVMDDTHQEFVALCAALCNADATNFVSELDALISHSIIHFEQENRWMEATAFPPASCHRGEHDAVLEIMQEVRRRYLGGERDLGERLAEELPAWFEHHVDTMDNMLAQFILKNEIDVAAISSAPTSESTVEVA